MFKSFFVIKCCPTLKCSNLFFGFFDFDTIFFTPYPHQVINLRCFRVAPTQKLLNQIVFIIHGQTDHYKTALHDRTHPKKSCDLFKDRHK